MGTNRGPGYAQHPEHTVVVKPFRGRVLVEAGNEVLVDTENALELAEANYPHVYYVPREDARMGRLQKTAHGTHCPFKGDASYFTVAGHDGGPALENAVWSYETPFDEVMAIKGHLAFYPNKLTIKATPAR